MKKTSITLISTAKWIYKRPLFCQMVGYIVVVLVVVLVVAAAAS